MNHKNRYSFPENQTNNINNELIALKIDNRPYNSVQMPKNRKSTVLIQLLFNI